MTLRSHVQQFAFDKLSLGISQAQYAGLVYEKFKLRQLIQCFRIDCVFDVGANRGQYADLIRSLGYVGPIVSFEPIPALAEALRKRAQGDPRWAIEQVALDASVRDVDFNISVVSNFSSIKRPKAFSDAPFAEINRTVESVRMKTDVLASYFDKYKKRFDFKAAFLKLDTQGSDLAVATGAGENLKEFVGIQSELPIQQLYHDQPTLQEALVFFQERGFAISAFLPTHPGAPVDIEVDLMFVNLANLERRAPSSAA